jgi:AcrR family transcriptional regulator
MTAVRTARARAREELVAAIKEAAGQQLAQVGAAALSLRAVARELGMVSSALYRYFPNRDALLTALIVDAYDAVGEAAERAEQAAADALGGERWLVVCRGVRRWALDHPHQWALVYGSPVPGYAAPTDTVASAIRLTRVMARIVLAAHEAGEVEPPEQPLPGPRLTTPAVAEIVGVEPGPPYEDLLERALTLVMALVGAVSYELFGHLHGGITDLDAYFDRVVAVSAEPVGLHVPLPLPGRTVGA